MYVEFLCLLLIVSEF